MKKNILALLPIVITTFITCTYQAGPANHGDHGKKPKANRESTDQADSSKLGNLLSKLPLEHLPANFSQWNNENNIDLTTLRHKKLFNLKYTLIPRAIGGASIDMNNPDSTFSLCDTTYKGAWTLVAKKPKFFIVTVDSNYLLLVTIDYNLNVIDAIHIAAGDPSSNDNFQGELTSTVYGNLKVVLNYSYSVRKDQEGNYDNEEENDTWRIDDSGHFKLVN